ncbi:MULTISPECIES: polyphosphate kinase 2 family protein [unclassified Janibacter]|uniref:polyphosphate kinase 2 family protein n=1 Tax=unclassified Janibacter TaxID=2649294 RepID=UPI003CFE57FA
MAKKDAGKKKDTTEGKGAAGKDATLKEEIAVDATAAEETIADAIDVVPGSFMDALRVREGFDLAALDPRSTPGFDGDKVAGKEAMATLAAGVSELQERLFAASKGGSTDAVLLVIQGMDTSGKGGIMRHVVGAVDPQGIALRAFKAPTAEERKHSFLWRIRNALPKPGLIGVFDRSHYEDVLIVRVHDLIPRAQWMRRYGQINTFEKKVVDQGTTIIKVMLHISSDEQKARLGERLERPDKHWKFNPGDIDERTHWEEYQEAYQALLDKTSTDTAPWFVVPADRKWYARLAVMNLLLEHLRALDPQWPEATFDVAEQKERLAAT